MAFKANTTKVQVLLTALKAGGVTEQQMQTSYLDIDTIPARGKAPRSFKVSNLVTIVREDPAEVLARESGTTLGDVISMSDQTVYADDDLRSRLSSLGYIGARSVEPGVEQMRFAVTVVFALRPANNPLQRVR